MWSILKHYSISTRLENAGRVKGSKQRFTNADLHRDVTVSWSLVSKETVLEPTGDQNSLTSLHHMCVL